jgi:hypothetical protein
MNSSNETQSNVVKQEQEAPVEPKKPYTPPTLIVYGKLTELTAGGTGHQSENGDITKPRRQYP